MTRLMVAIKAFIKAWKYPEKGESFLQDVKSKGSFEKKEPYHPSHLQLLSLLQQSGRFIDFIQEDISTYNDAQVGAAVRQIHLDCKKMLDEYVAIKPALSEEEGSSITIQAGFDPALIKLVGNLSKEPPFEGTIRHKGWIASRQSLPKKSGSSSNVLQAAEIEIK